MKVTKLKSRLKKHKPARTHVVWGSLLASMTIVGGLLLLLEDRPASGSAPIAMVGLTSAPGSKNLDALFNLTAPVEPGRWTGIVIHHSGMPVGSAASITDQHNSKGFKGLGYHFVISNGQGSPDGQIFVGYRWQEQLPGVHVGGSRAEYFNSQTIGICLVGDGERRDFTDAQLSKLAELVSTLQARLDIPDRHVMLHREVAPTSSPGRLFPELKFRQMLADAR